MINKNITTTAYFGVCFLLFYALSSLTCSEFPNLAGAGSETTNSIVGKVIDTQGTPAPSTIVHLIPSSFNNVNDPTTSVVMTDTTDSLGMYVFSKIPHGDYNIQAMNPVNGTRLFKGRTRVCRMCDTFPAETLQKPGTVEISFADHTNLPEGYVYIIGTLIRGSISGYSGYMRLDSVPAGTLPSIFFDAFSGNRDTSLLIADSVLVHPGATTEIFCLGWGFSSKLYFNTTASGAGISNKVFNFPVLVRLNSGNFRFEETKNDGSDIRFSKSNNAPLSHEIARWDHAGRLAEVWVLMDTVYGNDSTRYMIMRWGNSLASSLSYPAAVFDTSLGFQCVWHMETGNPNARDATKNQLIGISGGVVAPDSTPGIIGSARRFNGASQFFTIPGSAAGSLNFPLRGTYTISAWVFVDNPAPSTYTLVSKGRGHYSVFVDSALSWSFVYSLGLSNISEKLTGPKASMNTWKYITCIRNEVYESFYENGTLISSSEIPYKQPIPYSTAYDVTVGRDPATGAGYFSGKIDELNMADVARNADWIRLSYMNQKYPDALVVFK